MVIEIFNCDLLDKYSKCFSVDCNSIPKMFKKILPEQKSSKVNVIFVSKEEIKRLNLEYRDLDYVTDVLSFELGDTDISGEIYICPEYVYTTRGEAGFQEEILRLIVHGLLHLQGYDHNGEFEEKNLIQEDMFVKQEEILQNIIRNI
jgi:rRNA maturation RNase YbeY